MNLILGHICAQNKIATSMMILVLSFSMLTLALNIQPVKAIGTIYIMADGSVNPETAPINRNGYLYTFAANITEPIVVQADSVVLDGNGTTLQGTRSYYGITLSGRNSVTVKNLTIRQWRFGIYLYDSSNIYIVGNTITDCFAGIWISGLSNSNSVSGNTITDCDYGIHLSGSFNTISENTIKDGKDGVWLSGSSYNNTVSENNITANWNIGVMIHSCSNNTIVGNTIASGHFNVYLYWASSNNVSENTITEGWTRSVYLYGSTNNTVTGNNIKEGIYSVYLTEESNFNIISGNNIEFSYNSGIWFSKSSDNTVTGNTITAAWVGVNFYLLSNDSTVSGNMITNCDYGITPWVILQYSF
jgi:parallel beta-helix repeat protein